MNSPQTFWINHNSIGEFHGREKSMAIVAYKSHKIIRNKVAEIYKKDIEMFSYDWS